MEKAVKEIMNHFVGKIMIDGKNLPPESAENIQG
ncbi:MAG: hypothetical protein CM1200mP28_02590 [Deltaproteobacteria bacterium]|nr:MAG: hypothetical protein CM1200mP28_02590 [Deltaproteobacteria bacterium]